MKPDGKAIGAAAHLAATLLVTFGVVHTSEGLETAIVHGITAAVGLAASAAVIWKYIHHHGQTK